jgi:hypothetical protein
MTGQCDGCEHDVADDRLALLYHQRDQRSRLHAQYVHQPGLRRRTEGSRV